MREYAFLISTISLIGCTETMPSASPEVTTPTETAAVHDTGSIPAVTATATIVVEEPDPLTEVGIRFTDDFAPFVGFGKVIPGAYDKYMGAWDLATSEAQATVMSVSFMVFMDGTGDGNFSVNGDGANKAQDVIQYCNLTSNDGIITSTAEPDTNGFITFTEDISLTPFEISPYILNCTFAGTGTAGESISIAIDLMNSYDLEAHDEAGTQVPVRIGKRNWTQGNFNAGVTLYF